ncbi:MAG: S8 family peptidase [Eubacteriaceae bacterium]|nr:S8 family peptidase [Eubacteriaceae bacterium]
MLDSNSKLDDRAIEIFSLASANERISAIVFVNCDNACETRSKIIATGATIKYDIEILSAFVVDTLAGNLEDLLSIESIEHIAPDVEASTCLDIAKRTIGAMDTVHQGEGIGVAVLDTGVYLHPDLTTTGNRVVKFVDFIQGKKTPYDDNGHGTHCCGIIAGNGEVSNGRFVGIAPRANLVVLKVMNKNGEGRTSDILAGLDWVWKNRQEFNIKIISISLGAPYSAGSFDPLMLACEKLWNNGLVVVAAAGNEGPEYSTLGSPGISKLVITVGCSDDHRTVTRVDDTVPSFSSRGPSPFQNEKPDVIAPGVNIMSLAHDYNGYSAMSGTSMATPMVSGACAIMLSANPSMTPNEIKKALIKNAYSLKLSKLEQGSGIIDLGKMIL